MKLSSPGKFTLAMRLIPASVALLWLSQLAADEENAPDSIPLEPITVTGTRIPHAELETSAPMTVIDRTDLERMGTTGLGELLQKLPMMSGSPASSGRNFSASLGPADGSVALDLRGMGASRTLVLLNGQRMPSQSNDLSVVPVAMVERVEILKSGSSAIYGADAVSGVVNIVTRQDVEGATLNLQTGKSFDLNGRNSSANFIWGHNFELGNVVLGIEYTEQKPILASQYHQPWLRQDLSIIDPQEFRRHGFSSGPWEDLDDNGAPGWADTGSSLVPNGRFDLRLWNPVARSWTICRDSQGGGSLVGDYGPPGPPGDCGPGTYNYAQYYYVQTPYERSSVFLQSSLSVTDSVRASFEARYSNRQSQQNWAPLAYDTLGELDPAVSADNAYNPFGVDIPRWGRRLVEGGDRLFTEDIDQWQIVAGLQGEITSGSEWNISYNHGRRDRRDVRYGELDAGRLARALGPSFVDSSSGQVVCGTPQQPVTDCVALNPFTNPQTNPITARMLDWLTLPLREQFETERQVLDATLNTKRSFAGRPLAAAVGYEYRRESYTRTPDEAAITASTNSDWGNTTDGSYRVQSVFAELQLPLVLNQRGMSLVDLELAARHDDASINDAVGTWQAGLRWHASSELMLRATAARMFREPNISELFARQEENFVEANDPCSGIGGTPGGVPGSGECEDVPPGYVQFDPGVRVIEGGNENLATEKGSSYSVGLVWTPRFADGLNVTLDWWHIDLDDAIGKPGAAIVLSGCFSGAAPGFCDSIHRFGPESALWGEIERVAVTPQNVGPERAEGIDWSAAYAINSATGLWALSWFGTWNIERRALVLRDANADGVAEAVLTDIGGRFEHRSLTRPSAYPEWRWRFNIDWSREHWGASLSIDYIGKLTECGTPRADPYWLTVYCPDDPQVTAINAADTYFGIPLSERTWENTVGATWYVDFAVRYSIPKRGTQLTAGITNLNDKSLPFFQQGSTSSTDGDTFRTLGRTWFARLRQEF